MRKEFSESLLTIASQNKLNVLKASGNFKNNIIDLIIVSEMPVAGLTSELKESLNKTWKLMVIEEHV